MNAILFYIFYIYSIRNRFGTEEVLPMGRSVQDAPTAVLFFRDGGAFTMALELARSVLPNKPPTLCTFLLFDS